MKKTGFLLSLCVAALGFSFTSCSDDPDHPDKNVLETPILQTPQVTHESAVISWKKCANADMYLYKLNDGQELMTYEPTVTLTGLTPETSYHFVVKARKDGSDLYADSEYAEIDFTTTGAPVVSGGNIYHVATFGNTKYTGDRFIYEYNPDWTVKRVYRTVDDTPTGDVDREWVFTYNGNQIEVRGKDNYDITLNDKGVVEKLISGSKTYEYVYDEDGYMIQAMKDGDVVSNITVEDGNIVAWSKFSNGDEQWKLHTYNTSEPNVSGCHAIYSEQIGVSRWIVETGLFGKACKNLHETNQWNYSEKGSTFTFEFDSNGCVIAEHKLYGDSLEDYAYTYFTE